VLVPLWLWTGVLSPYVSTMIEKRCLQCVEEFRENSTLPSLETSVVQQHAYARRTFICCSLAGESKAIQSVQGPSPAGAHWLYYTLLRQDLLRTQWRLSFLLLISL
jgi:hypothetical protein